MTFKDPGPYLHSFTSSSQQPFNMRILCPMFYKRLREALRSAHAHSKNSNPRVTEIRVVLFLLHLPPPRKETRVQNENPG